MMDASRVPIEIPPKAPLDGVDLIKVFEFFDLQDNPPQQELFIRVRDEYAYLNPILKWNFELCYPEVDISNLDTSKYRIFSRKSRPSLSVYEKNQTLKDQKLVK